MRINLREDTPNRSDLGKAEIERSRSGCRAGVIGWLTEIAIERRNQLSTTPEEAVQKLTSKGATVA